MTYFLRISWKFQISTLNALYFKTIRSEQLKNYEIENSCSTYNEVILNLIPDFITKQNFHNMLEKDENGQFQKIQKILECRRPPGLQKILETCKSP